MASPKPYTVAIPDAVLTDLRERLERTRLPAEIPGTGPERGMPHADLTRLVEHWKNGYDWRRREVEINKLPMFTTSVDVDGAGSVNLHFVHQKSKVEGAIPLLFVHGWPGHFLEVEKILPLLTSPSSEHPSFHVVAPSLPGFGFSEHHGKSNFGISQYAEACDKLMLSLGYDQYVTQGGDWGSFITRFMAVRYGGRSIRASHSNMPMGTPSWKTPLAWVKFALSMLTPDGQMRIAAMKNYEVDLSGYSKQQSTRPATLGFALADSPAGLLAWITEKLYEWTDSYPWTDDEILDWVMIYWVSASGPAASLHIYYECFGQIQNSTLLTDYVSVPFGMSQFPKEMVPMPPSFLYATHNVVFANEHAHGGHFAAHEQPIELVGDIRKMFGKGGPAYGVVDGSTGY